MCHFVIIWKKIQKLKEIYKLSFKTLKVTYISFNFGIWKLLEVGSCNGNLEALKEKDFQFILSVFFPFFVRRISGKIVVLFHYDTHYDTKYSVNSNVTAANWIKVGKTWCKTIIDFDFVTFGCDFLEKSLKNHWDVVTV